MVTWGSLQSKKPYIYICIYTYCIYIYIHTVYIYTHVHTHTNIYTIIYIYIYTPVVPARGGAEVALGYTIRPFSSIELACAVRQRARACVFCFQAAALLSKNRTCARPRCNATPSDHFSHSSHCILHTPHSTLHTCTSSQLISSELFSSHFMSSHLSAKFFISAHRHKVPFIAGCSHFTWKNRRFRAPASSPKQSPFNSHAAITMRFAATCAHPCGHYNAICIHMLQNTKGEPITPETIQTATAAHTHTRYPSDSSPAAATLHEKRKVSCSGFLRKTKPLSQSCSHSMRYAATRAHPCSHYIAICIRTLQNTKGEPITPETIQTATAAHTQGNPLTFASSLRHHFPSSPLPFSPPWS